MGSSQSVHSFLNIEQRGFPGNLDEDKNITIGFVNDTTVFGLCNWNDRVDVF